MSDQERETPQGDRPELWNLGAAKVTRYEHGGGRVWFECENGTRDLVIDIYASDDEHDPDARREAILRRLGASPERKQ